MINSMTKTKEELSKMDLTEMTEYVAELAADVDKHEHEKKEAIDDKERHEKMAKKAEDEHEKEKHAMEEEHKKHEATLKAVLKAMEEEDHEKREAMIKEAMKDHEHGFPDAKKGSHEDDEEKKAMKAELTYMASYIKKPKLDQLNRIYSAARIDEATLKQWNEEWSAMTIPQLDAALLKAKPVQEMTGQSFEAQDKKSPFGFSGATSPVGTQDFSASKDFDKIDEMSVEDAFGQGGIH